MQDECAVQHKKKKLNVDTRRNHRFFPLLSEAGIRSGTAKKAKKRLGVVSTKPCIEWYWSLPE